MELKCGFLIYWLVAISERIKTSLVHLYSIFLKEQSSFSCRCEMLCCRGNDFVISNNKMLMVVKPYDRFCVRVDLRLISCFLQLFVPGLLLGGFKICYWDLVSIITLRMNFICLQVF